MSYSLNEWNHPKTGEVRLYINGTNRKGIYLALGRTGNLIIGSKAIDTPHRYQTGNHYQKVRKDNETARTVCEAYGLSVGNDTEGEFDRALQIARDGVEVSDD